jgi:oligoendopeptidase F
MPTDTLEKLPREFSRKFMPANLEIKGFTDVEPLLQKLLKADISTQAALEQWLLDTSELFAAIDEFGSRVFIRNTVDTTNPEYKKAFLDFVENFDPKLKPVATELNKKFKASPARERLNLERYKVFTRSVLNRIELYRDENVKLEIDESKLEHEYDEIMGATTVQFDGKEQTPQAMAKYQLEISREVREKAWRATAERRLADADKVNVLYEKLVRLREKKASNAGFANFRDYQFKRRERFEYTPADCEAYHDAVDKVVIPAVKRIHKRRAEHLKLKALRPWDTSVDADGKPPLKPFEDVEKLKDGCARIFHKVDEELGGYFDKMRSQGLLDLANRKGKAPGGYQSTLSEVRLPFIFMNAVGVDGDVQTLLHEGGHAFHAWLSRKEPLLEYRGAPIEFCEVASMSMELLGNPYLGEFYPEAELKRARRDFYEGILEYLPWFATIDAYQQWVYTHNGHGTDERLKAWLDVFRRFNPTVDWKGLEKFEQVRWQMQGHLFGSPFYYIEYAIAQLGALQVWLNARKDRAKAISQYKFALSLGGSKPLPELFKAAGAKFDFSAKTVKPLVEAVEAELATLE